MRDYNNQTSWTKNSNDMSGFERETRQQFSITFFPAAVFTFFFP